MKSWLDMHDICLIEVLSKWVSLIGLMKLDSAVCSRTDRNQLLQLFLHVGFVIEDALVNSNILKYLNLRRMKAKRVLLRVEKGRSVDLKLDNSKLENLSVICSLPSRRDYSRNIIPFINTCTALKSLALCSCRGSLPYRCYYVEDIDPLILKNLSHFCGPSDTDPSTIESIAKHCKQLRSLSLGIHCVKRIVGEAILNLVRSNTNLLRVVIFAEKIVKVHLLIDAFASCCPMIRRIYLTGCKRDLELLRSVRNLVKECTVLKFFCVEGICPDYLVRVNQREKIKDSPCLQLGR